MTPIKSPVKIEIWEYWEEGRRIYYLAEGKSERAGLVLSRGNKVISYDGYRDLGKLLAEILKRNSVVTNVVLSSPNGKFLGANPTNLSDVRDELSTYGIMAKVDKETINASKRSGVKF